MTKIATKFGKLLHLCLTLQFFLKIIVDILQLCQFSFCFDIDRNRLHDVFFCHFLLLHKKINKTSQQRNDHEY